MKMKHILYISSSRLSQSEANSIQVLNMMIAFTDLDGYAVDLLYHKPLSGNNEQIDTTILDARVNFRKFGVPYVFKSSIINSILVFPLFNFLRRYEIIYSRNVWSAFILCIFKRKVIYESHVIFRKRTVLYFIERFVLRSKNLERCVFISNALKQRVMSSYGIKDDPRYIVAHDSACLVNEFVASDSSEIRYDFGYFGSGSHGKGVYFVLEIAKHFPDKKFLICGPLQSDIVKLNKKCEELELNNVDLKERTSQVMARRHMTECAVLLLPNLKHQVNAVGSYGSVTSPLKLFEYMASNRPILSSRIPSVLEVLNDKNAFLANAEDVEDWVSQIKKIFANHRESEKTANQALVDVTDYTWEKRAKMVIGKLN